VCLQTKREKLLRESEEPLTSDGAASPENYHSMGPDFQRTPCHPSRASPHSLINHPAGFYEVLMREKSGESLLLALPTRMSKDVREEQEKWAT
jgi:hypothetical protein